MNKKIYKAFTLIELLVVIAIVGILAGFIFVAMNGAINSAQDTKIKADMATIEKAVMEYAALNNGAYPALLTDLIPTYLGVIPANPIGGSYTYTNLTTSFTLSGTLTSGLPWVYNSTTNSWNSGFAYGQYKQPITINNSGSALSNYQIKIIVNSANMGATPFGHILDNSTFNDLRFTDSGNTALNYWIETPIIAGTANVWVNVASIPNGASTIYMYYGTQTAAGVNGALTFPLLFDDFPASPLSSQWQITAGTPTFSGSVVTLAGATTAIRTNNTFGTNTAIRARMKTGHFGNTSGGSPAEEYLCFTISSWEACSIYAFDSASIGGVFDNCTSTHNTSPIVGWSAGTWGITDIIRNGSTSDIYKINNANTVTITAQTSTANLKVQIGTGFAASAIYSDWIFVRAYTASEPTVTTPFGAEDVGL
ncbi:MAG: DUF2341 domain-containing protein [Candidatus Paceibacterota bacterium]